MPIQGKVPFSQVYADAIKEILQQLIIVLIERLGGSVDIPVEEIDSAGDKNLTMKLGKGRFNLTVIRK